MALTSHYKIDPHLISVRIQDGNQYKCEIEVDDRDGRLPLPPLQANVEVRLGWERERMFKMFAGMIIDSSTASAASRAAGACGCTRKAGTWSARASSSRWTTTRERARRLARRKAQTFR